MRDAGKLSFQEEILFLCVCVCVKFYPRWLTHQSEQIKQLVNGLNNQMIIVLRQIWWSTRSWALVSGIELFS